MSHYTRHWIDGPRDNDVIPCVFVVGLAIVAVPAVMMMLWEWLTHRKPTVTTIRMPYDSLACYRNQVSR